MIRTEIIIINGKQYKRTYSDKYHIERDGAIYAEAVDPVDTDRKYTETDVLLPTENLDAEQALNIITGGEPV